MAGLEEGHHAPCLLQVGATGRLWQFMVVMVSHGLLCFVMGCYGIVMFCNTMLWVGCPLQR